MSETSPFAGITPPTPPAPAPSDEATAGSPASETEATSASGATANVTDTSASPSSPGSSSSPDVPSSPTSPASSEPSSSAFPASTDTEPGVGENFAEPKGDEADIDSDPEFAGRGAGPATPLGDTGGDPLPGVEHSDNPLTIETNRDGTEHDIAGSSLEVADVPASQTIVGTNPADGRPTVVDPDYVDRSGDTGRFDVANTARQIREDPDSTEAERGTGERTLTGTPPMDVIDGRYVGMAPAAEFRPRHSVRALRMNQAFTAGGGEGGAGDYLAEGPDGKRFVLSQAELDEHFVAV